MKKYFLFILFFFITILSLNPSKALSAIGGYTVWPPSFTLTSSLSVDQNTLSYTVSGNKSGSNKQNCGDFVAFPPPPMAGGYTGGWVVVDPSYMMDNGVASVVGTSISGNISASDIVQQTTGHVGTPCNDIARYTYGGAVDQGAPGTFNISTKSLNVSSLANGTYTLSVRLCSTADTTAGAFSCYARTQSFTIARAAGFNVSASAGAGGSVTSASYNGTGGTVNPDKSVTVTPPNSKSANFTLTPSSTSYTIDNTFVTGNPPAKCPTNGTGWTKSSESPGMADTYTTGDISDNCTYTFTFNSVSVSAPVVTISVNPTTANAPVTPTLTWSATNSPTSCTASNAWSGTQPTSGTNVAQATLNTAGTYTYTLACTNASGTGTASATINVSNMTGTLTASDCFITAGNNSCLSSLTWTTTNPVGISAVTTPTNITVANDNNGTATYPIVPGVGARQFYLYNNAVQLATATATASCATGTSWDTATSTCKTVAGTMSGTLTPSPTSCTVVAGASSCSVNLSWTTTNPVATSAVTSVAGTEATGNNGGPQAFTVPFPNRTFSLYNNAQLLATSVASASCASGSTWDTGTGKCKSSTAMTGFLSHTTPSCVIALNASTCNINFSWNTLNPVAVSSVTKPTNITVATGNNGFNIPFAINYGGNTFYLFNNGIELATDTVSASAVTCTAGTYWDGTKCSSTPPPPCANGALNPPTCTVNSGGTCLNGAIDPPTCTNLSGGGSSGTCAPTHYKCSTGTSANNASHTSNWTWTCGSGLLAPASCAELKTKPIFKEN